MNRLRGPLLLFLGLALSGPAHSRQLQVPSGYRTISAAIQAASSGDSIAVAPGIYREQLAIAKSVALIGPGPSRCTLHFPAGDGAVISANGARLIIKGMEVNGGELVSASNQFPGDSPGGLYSGSSSRGIHAAHTTLVLDDVVVNNIHNYLVTVTNGVLEASRLHLATRRNYYKNTADIGVRVLGSRATISAFSQTAGNIDHTVDINNPGRDQTEWARSSVEIRAAHVRSSSLSWGDCFRTFSNSYLTIESSICYRAAGGEPPQHDNHTGVSVNGYGNTVRLAGNDFVGVPWGISVYGSKSGSNTIVIEKNRFRENVLGGIRVYGMGYAGLDLGGGALGSAGGNRFHQIGGYDVKLIQGSTADIPAFNNIWSRDNPGAAIWDGADESGLGLVRWR